MNKIDLNNMKCILRHNWVGVKSNQPQSAKRPITDDKEVGFLGLWGVVFYVLFGIMEEERD